MCASAQRISPERRVGTRVPKPKECVMESIVPLIIQLVSGAVGGNTGSLMKNSSWASPELDCRDCRGRCWRTDTPALLGAGASGGGMDIGSIISSIAGGGVGGGLLMAIIGIIKGSRSSNVCPAGAGCCRCQRAMIPVVEPVSGFGCSAADGAFRANRSHLHLW